MQLKQDRMFWFSNIKLTFLRWRLQNDSVSVWCENVDCKNWVQFDRSSCCLSLLMNVCRVLVCFVSYNNWIFPSDMKKLSLLTLSAWLLTTLWGIGVLLKQSWSCCIVMRFMAGDLPFCDERQSRVEQQKMPFILVMTRCRTEGIGCFHLIPLDLFA